MKKLERENKVYAAIDLKSFYASVECQERGLDPLVTNLVVADESRTDKTICLAVSPALKKYGIPGRCRLFEVRQKVKQINRQRRESIRFSPFRGSSCDERELAADPYLQLDFHIAVPRMAFYIDYSTRVYDVYTKYISPDDIHVYSIDEVFIDLTPYLKTYGLTAHEMTVMMIRDVLRTTGITATAGIGTNMFLAKAAMDIVAKHIPADEDGVRIAELDEASYRRQLWTHEPLIDFWRVGRGYVKRLQKLGLYTMGDIARQSLQDEEVLYKEFGVNAELLIDHAWGYEPCTIADIKAYKPSSNSIGSGQVLPEPYSHEKAGLIVREMTDSLVLELVRKKLKTDHIMLMIGYDIANLSRDDYDGEVTRDWYGRQIPKSAAANVRLKKPTDSASRIREAVMAAYEKVTDRNLLVRRIMLTAGNVVKADKADRKDYYAQIDLFSDGEKEKQLDEQRRQEEDRERKVQEAILKIQDMYGKNAVLKGMDLEDGATRKQRNEQIGGHKA